MKLHGWSTVSPDGLLALILWSDADGITEQISNSWPLIQDTDPAVYDM